MLISPIELIPPDHQTLSDEQFAHAVVPSTYAELVKVTDGEPADVGLAAA